MNSSLLTASLEKEANQQLFCVKSALLVLCVFFFSGPVGQTHDNQDCSVSDHFFVGFCTSLDPNAYVWMEQVCFRVVSGFHSVK
jgi:hypothetical protein